MGQAQIQSDPQTIDDTDLLDEVDELILSKLTELESDGVSGEKLAYWADYYGRVYDLLYLRFSGQSNTEHAELISISDQFKDDAWEFLAESYWAKIENIYDPDLCITEEQANEVIVKTRLKLRRFEQALFGR